MEETIKICGNCKYYRNTCGRYLINPELLKDQKECGYGTEFPHWELAKENLTKGTVLTENVATIFIMDTLLASADGRKLDELMMEKHSWNREKYNYYKGIYISWMCNRSANIDVFGNIKKNNHE